MSRKIIIEKLNNIYDDASRFARYNDLVFVFHFEDGRLDKIDCCDGGSMVGGIYAGHVKDVVNNIGAAFVTVGDETGYFDLKEEKPVFLNPKNSDKICSGDSILVQVSKDKRGTKGCTLTSNIELAGSLCVLMTGVSGIRFSGKIRDEHLKKKIKDEFFIIAPDTKDKNIDVGFIIRTNAYGQEPETVAAEMKRLYGRLSEIKNKAACAKKGSLIMPAQNDIIKILRDIYTNDDYEIVIEDGELLKCITSELAGDGHVSHIREYSDRMIAMNKLYSLKKLLEDALNKNVWLKSGARLVIEQTEALVSIDVNTGKCGVHGKADKTFLAINLEAAEEIARQIRIRNLSGIIVVDFINMVSDEDNAKLVSAMKKFMDSDRITSDVAGLTNLGLMEITRKKTKRPLGDYLK